MLFSRNVASSSGSQRSRATETLRTNKLNELIFSTSENVLYSAYGYHRETCNKLFKVMGFFGFLFGLGAAVVVVMLMLGIMFVPGCDESKKKIVPSQSSAAQSVGSEQELWRVIKEERLKHFPSRKTINLISAAWSDRGSRLETLGLLALQERMV